MGLVTINTLTTNQTNVNATDLNNLSIPLANEFNGSIDNTNLAANAAIAYSKLSLGGSILNADINASAAIVDTKLAQITTASKVHGTAITGLASLPSGAGLVPIANLPTTGLVSFDSAESTGLSATSTGTWTNSGVTTVTMTPAHAENVVQVDWFIEVTMNTDSKQAYAALSIGGTELTYSRASADVGTNSPGTLYLNGSYKAQLAASSQAFTIEISANGGTTTAVQGAIYVSEHYYRN